MDFLSEVRHIIAALPAGDDEAIQAAFALACHPWNGLRHPDITAWDLFAMDLLAAREALYPQSAPIMVPAGAATAPTSELMTAVADLATALGDRLDDIARDRRRGVAQRLAHAAAAHQVHLAALQQR